MSRRRLNDEEVALWKKVAETAERLHRNAPVRSCRSPNPNR